MRDYRGPTRQRRKHAALLLAAALLVGASASCSKSGGRSEGIVVVNAPVAGRILRVLATEGAVVSEGSAIVEIALQSGSPGPQGPEADPQAQSRAAVESSQREIAEAEADVQRALVDVQRAEQSVASGLSSQAEVDAARARYQQAQQRLDGLRDKARAARDNLTFQRGRGSTAPAAPRQEIVTVRVPAAGTVRAISARAGQQVAAGQPIATLSPSR